MHLRQLFALLLLAAPAGHAGAEPAAVRIPPPECRAHVGYDRDADLPGYRIDGVCVPFTATAEPVPPGYVGDFRVDAFTDTKLRERWHLCQQQPDCRARIDRHVEARRPPNREFALRYPPAVRLLGRVPDVEPLDLALIRRPAFFGQAPWHEPIAALDRDTFVVEFTVPAEPFERIALHSRWPVKLRGWYIRGAGVADGKGGHRRALVIFSAGGGGRLVAIEDPASTLYEMRDGRSRLHRFPDERTGASGMRAWRGMLARFHAAGFDILDYDRRGVGLSTGYSDTNTLQQGRDILTVIAALRSGAGLRARAPDGRSLAGRAAAAALRGGAGGAGMPVLLAGSSRGTIATGWAMTRNFDRACDYDLPGAPCGPALGDRSIKGAIQFSDFTAGPGYLTADTSQDDADRPLFEAGTEEAYHIVFFPSSAILAGVHRWPALFIGRGLFDYAESLEGAIDAYDRVDGLKEIAVTRAPHPMEVWPPAERERIFDRAIAFATAAALDRHRAPGGREWHTMKELVATAGEAWEPSSRPR